MSFGKFLSAKRLEKKMSLRDLGRAVRLTPAYISDIERGARRPPNPDVVIRLATALGLDPIPLLTESLNERTSVEFQFEQDDAPSKKEALLAFARLWDDLDEVSAVALKSFLDDQGAKNA